ncbi:hypothetical protein Poli38472_001988 [Pythium oligandrum]|uniref:Transmembrane protein n=1 Tax=Pythium oligandrum TaxID=41045 RepID=A0A8K1CTV5_PYTOL|nr:hypothetical protein Poli38472_001988 [Pythium oligandrum]|eukprot:TMW69832.1 hypothetical protein Poli38472_001988 [Pythium oligandrum]
MAVLFFPHPASLRTTVAVYSLLTQTLSTSVLWLVLQFDLTRLVLQTFDFWYMTLTNVLCAGMIGFALDDSRMLAIVGNTVAFELALMIDANHRSARLTALSTLFGASLNIFFALALILRWFPTRSDLILVYHHKYALGADDVATNALGTSTVMLLYYATRKLLVTRRQERIRLSEHSNIKMTTCITYRCRIRLCASSTQSKDVLPCPTDSHPVFDVVPLQLVPVNELFSAANVISPSARRFVGRHNLAWCLRCIGFVGIITNPLAFSVTNESAATSLALLSFATTTLHCGSYWLVTHRRLLWHLMTCFECVFLSFQVTLCTVAVCDMVSYDMRMLAVLSMWQWMHWVITLDTVTPEMKRRLGWTRFFTALVMAIFALEHAMLGADFMIWGKRTLRDRVILTLTLGSSIQRVRVVPFLFGRMVTTLWWPFVLLWRLYDGEDDELFMLLGEVQYEQRTRRPPDTIAKMTPVVPSVTS